MDLSEVEYGKYVEDDFHFLKTTHTIHIQEPEAKGKHAQQKEKTTPVQYNRDRLST